MNQSNNNQKNKCCDYKEHQITLSDLPLCCPMHQETLWNGHPRIYLPIEKTGTFQCPYCGTMYILEQSEKLEQNALKKSPSQPGDKEVDD